MSMITATCAICGTEFPSRTSYGLCATCVTPQLLREFDRVESMTRKVQRAGGYANLDLLSWMSTISDHRGLCGYCLTVPYSQIHMVDPAKGLIWENVVPICKACSHFTQFSWDAAVERVHVYLESDQLPDEPYEACELEQCPRTEYIPARQAMAEIFAVEPWQLDRMFPFQGGEPA